MVPEPDVILPAPVISPVKVIFELLVFNAVAPPEVLQLPLRFNVHPAVVFNPAPENVKLGYVVAATACATPETNPTVVPAL